MVSFGTLCLAFYCMLFIVSFPPSNGMHDEEIIQSVFHTNGKLIREGNIRYDGQTRTPVAVYGPDFFLEGNTPEELANDFITHHSSILEVDVNTSSSKLRYVSHRRTGDWVNMYFNQVVNTGLPVFHSRVVVTIDKNKMVKMITSSYKKGVHVNTDKLSPHMTSDDVRNEITAKYLTTKYIAAKTKSLRHYHSQLGVYPREKMESVVAWKVEFAATDELIEYSVIIDDRTREVLEEEDVTLDKRGREREEKNKNSENLRSRRKESKDILATNSFSGRLLQFSILRAIFLIIVEAFEDILIVLGLEQEPAKVEITTSPSANPTAYPSHHPSHHPSPSPTKKDSSNTPSSYPHYPSHYPSPSPTKNDSSNTPSLYPSSLPSLLTQYPSISPTNSTSSSPSASSAPTTSVVGNVFDPDPISSGKGSYGTTKDNNDNDNSYLASQLVEKNLRDVKYANNKYHLEGPWAQIVDEGKPNTGLFSQESPDFRFTRNEQGFEAVNAYYHIDNIMRYINNDLGIEVSPYQYEGGVKFDPHGSNSDDNSFYSSFSGHVEMGEGGVDDAEDPDVIIHELGHGLHDWLTKGGLSQVNGLSEGFGDYVAMSYSRSKGIYTEANAEYHWVFKWDGHNEFWGGRITNYDAKYPDDLVNQVHTDGQIWSTCNMKIWDLVGREKSDKAHFMGISSTNSNSNQEDVANAIIQAAPSAGFTDDEISSTITIYAACGYDVSNDVCGDGIIGPSEECEPTDVGNATCSSGSGCSAGVPVCTQSCKLDYSSCSPADDEIKFDLMLKTDDYPQETSWTLNDDQGVNVLTSEFYNADTVYNVTTCLPSDTCYDFTIKDTQSDGICCGYGEGSYSIFFDGETVANTVGNFGSQATHKLCPSNT